MPDGKTEVKHTVKNKAKNKVKNKGNTKEGIDDGQLIDKAIINMKKTDLVETAIVKAENLNGFN